MKMSISPLITTPQGLVDDYFNTLRVLCEQKMTKSKQGDVQFAGQQMLHVLLSVLLQTSEPEDTHKIFESIQNRFLLVLQDYDLPWVWEIYKEFSSSLPETMLN